MYLGTRKIRSAGRTSGSIEITLPSELRVLLGMKCRLMVRNSARPEIVLQPELSAAQAVFHSLWENLRLGLSEIDDIGEFSLIDFTVTLFPPPHWYERPPLVYTDALIALRQQGAEETPGTHESEAMTRLFASMAVVAAGRLGLEGSLALAFGDAVSYCIFGGSAGLGTDFERGMAHRAFWNGGTRCPVSDLPFGRQVWLQAQPGFGRVYTRFHLWQEQPEAYATARQNWHRALSMEIETQMAY